MLTSESVVICRDSCGPTRLGSCVWPVVETFGGPPLIFHDFLLELRKSGYLQQTKDIWERLQSEVARQNQEIANSLKDALLKVDVGPEHVPALSLLYQNIRTVSTVPAGDRSS